MKVLSCIIPLLLTLSLEAKLETRVHADTAILMNADTGAILYEKNPHKQRAPASITKIATAFVALEEKGNTLQTPVAASRNAIGSISTAHREKSNFTVPTHWIEVGGTHIGIKAGEELTFETLLYGLMLCSGNDAANVIAEYVCDGSIPQFMDKVNERLQEIGCSNTYFNSAHGHHHPEHLTTAYDMALLTKEALKNPNFRKIVSTTSFPRPETKFQKGMTLVQSNKLLRKSSPYYYDKAIGVKTGHGSRAKQTFVAAATDQGRTLIVVLMGTKERKDNFKDAAKLFELAFNQPQLTAMLINSGPQPYTLTLEGSSKPLKTYSKNAYQVEYYQGEEPKIEAQLTWEKDLQIPIQKHQKVASITLLNADGAPLQEIPLYAKKALKHSGIKRIQQLLLLQAPLTEYLLLALLLAGILLCYLIFSKRRINS